MVPTTSVLLSSHSVVFLRMRHHIASELFIIHVEFSVHKEYGTHFFEVIDSCFFKISTSVIGSQASGVNPY